MSLKSCLYVLNPADNVVSDALSDFLRDSAQKMLKVAIEEEVQNFISSYKDKRLSNGNVHHGHSIIR